MLLEQVDCLFGYWRSAPPVHELVASYMGIKPESVSSEVTLTESERDLVARMNERMAARG